MCLKISFLKISQHIYWKVCPLKPISHACLFSQKAGIHTSHESKLGFLFGSCDLVHPGTNVQSLNLESHIHVFITPSSVER